MMSAQLQVAGVCLVLALLPACTQSQKIGADEICDDYRTLRLQQDSLTQEIFHIYSSDPLFLQKFAQSREAWEQFCESHLSMKFPRPDKQYTYGSNYPMCVCLERIYLAELRISQLNAWVQGTAQKGTCPGSVLVE
ncbi:MAG: hypothetical protein GF398_05090 [Chitinivibrionales bacterium]|nr:hypothetical protein [Chitinivibrionales bacterium]